MKRNGKSWFRVHVSILGSRKVQTLQPALLKWLLNLWAIAAEHDGVLPSADDIAWRLRSSSSAVQSAIDQLIAKRLLDHVDGEVTVHDWSEWQFDADSSTERVRRFWDRKSTAQETHESVTRNVSETFRKRPQNRTDTEQIQTRTETEHIDRFGNALLAAWDRHLKHRKDQPQDAVIATLLGRPEPIDLHRLESNHPGYCAYWDRHGWSFCGLSLLEYIDAGMPPAPPEPNSRQTENDNDQWAAT